MTDSPKALVLPFYVVVDVSGSMAMQNKIDAVNAILPAIGNALQADPILDDKTRFSVIDFSDDARVVMPMCKLLSQDQLPVMSTRNGTQFAKAFEKLRVQIEADAKQLRGDNLGMYRPAVFLITDGEPTDTPGVWQKAFSELTNGKIYPNIIPMGVGAANERVLVEMIYPKNEKMRMFLVKDGADGAEAIKSIASVLLDSVVLSGGTGSLTFPQPSQMPAGVVAKDKDGDVIDLDDLELD